MRGSRMVAELREQLTQHIRGVDVIFDDDDATHSSAVYAAQRLRR
jgi:hypothetical protein